MTPEFGFMPDHRRFDDLTIAGIVAAFSTADEALKRELWNSLRGFVVPEIKEHVKTRYLSNGQEVRTDASGAPVALPGESYGDVIDFVSGSLAWKSKVEGRRLQVRMGGGADCMFDYLVSSCWAAEVAAGRGTEGQVMTSLSGCTFKVYSTVAAMVAQSFIDFGGSNISVAYICGGTYLETNISFAVNHRMRWIGAGRTRTVIGTTSSVTTDTIPMSTGAQLQVSGMTVRASTNAGSTKGGINMGGSGVLIAEDCVFRGRGTTPTDTASYAINGASSGFVFLTDCELQRNGFNANNETVAQFTHCYHSGGGCGIRCFNNTQITGCFFNGSAIGIARCGSNIQIVGNHFEDCTIGIQTTSGTSEWLTISDNLFDSSAHANTALDFSGGGTAQNYNWKITGNHFTNGTGATFIAWPAGTSKIHGVCAGNISDGDGTFSSGTIPLGMRMGPNFESNGAARTDIIGSGLQGIVQNGVVADNKTVRWNAFVIFWGTTKVIATPGSATYSTNSTYYISVNSSGVVTATTTGGFPPGEFPLATVTTDVVGTITAFEWYDGYIRIPANGAPPAPADAPFVTIGNSAALSAERALTLSPADGEHLFTDLGNTVTLVGADATATQKGHAILGQPMGLTGATAATRYVGATASGAPVSGTFAVGDFIIDRSGSAWVCTVAGSPGTWTQVAGGASGGVVRAQEWMYART